MLFTASFNETPKPRDRSNFSFEQTVVTDRPVFFSLSNRGEDQLKHKRARLGGRLDYKLAVSTRVYVK